MGNFGNGSWLRRSEEFFAVPAIRRWQLSFQQPKQKTMSTFPGKSILLMI